MARTERRPLEFVMGGRYRVDAIVQVLDAQARIGRHHAVVTDSDRVRMFRQAFGNNDFGAPGSLEHGGNRAGIEMVAVCVRAQDQAGVAYFPRRE